MMMRTVFKTDDHSEAQGAAEDARALGYRASVETRETKKRGIHWAFRCNAPTDDYRVWGRQ